VLGDGDRARGVDVVQHEQLRPIEPQDVEPLERNGIAQGECEPNDGLRQIRSFADQPRHRHQYCRGIGLDHGVDQSV
jgi:hypothetical protein